MNISACLEPWFHASPGTRSSFLHVHFCPDISWSRQGEPARPGTVALLAACCQCCALLPALWWLLLWKRRQGGCLMARALAPVSHPLWFIKGRTWVPASSPEDALAGVLRQGTETLLLHTSATRADGVTQCCSFPSPMNVVLHKVKWLN